ncbi:MAG TPA: carbohydrate-binding domain-containing protein, partial [Kiritimatiellia bacterium]
FNMRAASLSRTDGEPAPPDEKQVWLRPSNANPVGKDNPIRIEWLAEPPHFGFWNSGEKVAWTVTLAAGGTYQAVANYATPTKGTRFSLLVDGQPVSEKELVESGDWAKFSSLELGRIELTPGTHIVEAVWTTPESFGAGNFRDVRLQKLAGP